MTLPGELDIYKRLSFQSPYGGLSPRIQQSDISLWQGQPGTPQQQVPWWQRALGLYGQMQAPLWGAMGGAGAQIGAGLGWGQTPPAKPEQEPAYFPLEWGELGLWLGRKQHEG